MRIIGPNSTAVDRPRIAPFVARLGELGPIEGHGITIDYRSTEGVLARAGELAAEFAGLKVDVIVTAGDAQVLAAKQAAPATPIVFAATGDPVGNGLVASLSRPGGNVTGLSLLLTETAGKRLELLRESLPRLHRLTFLGNFSNPTVALELQAAQAAARTLGLDTTKAEVRSANDMAPAIEPLKGRTDALYVCQDPLVGANSVRINTLALAARLPTMLAFRDSVEAGGLISYGPDVRDLYRRTAEMVDKILRGTKPSDIPVEQPTKFDLVVNLKTAKTLGITVPEKVLARADEVIE